MREGGKEWVRVVRAIFFFKCGKGREGVGESGQELKGVE